MSYKSSYVNDIETQAQTFRYRSLGSKRNQKEHLFRNVGLADNL